LVAGPEVFDQNDSDMTAQLTKMQEGKADFIIAYSLAPAAVQISRTVTRRKPLAAKSRRPSSSRRARVSRSGTT